MHIDQYHDSSWKDFLIQNSNVRKLLDWAVLLKHWTNLWSNLVLIASNSNMVKCSRHVSCCITVCILPAGTYTFVFEATSVVFPNVYPWLASLKVETCSLISVYSTPMFLEPWAYIAFPSDTLVGHTSSIICSLLTSQAVRGVGLGRGRASAPNSPRHEGMFC